MLLEGYAIPSAGVRWLSGRGNWTGKKNAVGRLCHSNSGGGVGKQRGKLGWGKKMLLEGYAIPTVAVRAAGRGLNSRNRRVHAYMPLLEWL